MVGDLEAGLLMLDPATNFPFGFIIIVGIEPSEELFGKGQVDIRF